MYDPQVVKIDYTNYRGERKERLIIPHALRWASTEWEPETQWILEAYDIQKEARRDFAIQDIHSWEPA